MNIESRFSGSQGVASSNSQEEPRWARIARGFPTHSLAPQAHGEGESGSGEEGMNYRIEYAKSAIKDFCGIENPDALRITERIDALSDDLMGDVKR